MLTLPAELLSLIVAFAPVFTKPTFANLQVLLLGALLARGKRTVTACLRVLGLEKEKNYQNYHRVLNRARWSSLELTKILLGLLVALLPWDAVLVIGADDTIERRRGKKIKGIGCYRDAVRSSQKHVVKCFGLKWLSLMLLVRLPFSSRVWALPFLTLLCRAVGKKQEQKTQRVSKKKSKQKRSKKKEQKEQTAIDRLMQCVRLLRRWLPERAIVLVVDGGYAAVKLALLCASGPINVTLVMRLRSDSVFYHQPGPQPAGRRGPKPKKGARQRSLAQWANRSDTPWEEVEVDWYGGVRKKLKVFSLTGLWHKTGFEPVMLRYLLVRDPEGKLRDTVFGCTDIRVSAAQIIEWAVMRWSVEVTFEEVRAHLGVETGRQWSDLAIARTTPVLMGLFSLVLLLTIRLMKDGKVAVNQAAWYEKEEATFSDCLALVRAHFWRVLLFRDSTFTAESVLIPSKIANHLISCLALAL